MKKSNRKAHMDPRYPAIPFFISKKQIYLLEDIVNNCLVGEMDEPLKTRNRHRIIDLVEMKQRLIAAPVM